MEDLKNENIFEKELKISTFLFRVSEKTLECVELALFFIGKWSINLKKICDQTLKNIYIKACNEYKFKVFS